MCNVSAFTTGLLNATLSRLITSGPWDEWMDGFSFPASLHPSLPPSSTNIYAGYILLRCGSESSPQTSPMKYYYHCFVSEDMENKVQMIFHIHTIDKKFIVDVRTTSF